MNHTYEFPRAALTVDCVVFGFDEGDLKVLLIQRGIQPFKGSWALPGGFVRLDETLEEAARRELAEETGLKDVFLDQFGAFSGLDRDPRERVISVAYYALTKPEEHQTRATTDADDAQWFSAAQPPSLAFDHASILTQALESLRTKLRIEPLGFELLPPKFTLSQLQNLYEAVLGTALDKRNFRKKVLSFDLLLPLKETHRIGAHRPAQLFRFDPVRYQRLKKKGFHFEI